MCSVNRGMPHRDRLVKTDSVYNGHDLKGLQETNNSLIVLDANDLVVSCNNRAKMSLFTSHSGIATTLPLDCFWIETEQRIFHLSEFRQIAGKSIKLLLRPNYCDSYRIKVFIEAFTLLHQSFISLTIQEDMVQI